MAPWFSQNVCPTRFSLSHTLQSSYLASPRHPAIWQTRKAEWEMTAALLGFLWFQFDDRVRISMLLANKAVRAKQRVRVSDINFCKVLYVYLGFLILFFLWSDVFFSVTISILQQNDNANMATVILLRRFLKMHRNTIKIIIAKFCSTRKQNKPCIYH